MGKLKTMRLLQDAEMEFQFKEQATLELEPLKNEKINKWKQGFPAELWNYVECTGNNKFLTATGAFDKRRGEDNAWERTDLRRVVLIRDPNFCKLLGLIRGLWLGAGRNRDVTRRMKLQQNIVRHSRTEREYELEQHGIEQWEGDYRFE